MNEKYKEKLKIAKVFNERDCLRLDIINAINKLSSLNTNLDCYKKLNKLRVKINTFVFELDKNE